MNQIEILLRQTIGLHAATVGSALVEHAVHSRMRRRSLTDPADYLALLRRSPGEWNALIEALVVTETWFFRDNASFKAMLGLVFEEWVPAHPTGVLRLLSVPCATGEEPFSMAMALLESGLPGERFFIDAIDLSSRAIGTAQRAVYGRNSFRSPDLGFRSRYFQPVHGGFSLNPSVRKKVRFQKGNILESLCLAGTGAYDFIFCRNLLIYFDRATQVQTLAKLRRLLTPSGVLFLASAELALALDNGFAPVQPPQSFACRVSARSAPRRLRPVKPALKPHAPRPTVGMVPPALNGHKPTPVTHTKPVAGVRAGLEAARQFMEDGRLEEAAAICENHLHERGASAEAFYLLGLARDAAGADSQAREFYRKALYLEPGHQETLRRWAALSERNGDLAHARILRERAERRQRQPEASPVP